MGAPTSSTRPTVASRRVRADALPGRTDDHATVIFDVGGVLYDWDPRFLYEKLINDPDHLQWFLENVVTREWHFQHDAGRPARETTAELIAAFPEERALIDAYVPRWLETIPAPVPGVLPIVEELAAADVRLCAITNFSAEFWPRFAATAPIFRLFGDIVVSGVEKVVKPDPEIYAIAKRRFRLGRGKVLFVDDRDDNVRAAEDAGWDGHLFRNAEGLRARLVRDGWL